jgi:hypothetical protein
VIVAYMLEHHVAAGTIPSRRMMLWRKRQP